ncbi:MAG: hypothetical protein AB7F66_01945 [Bacteriovoracia bacterium]
MFASLFRMMGMGARGFAASGTVPFFFLGAGCAHYYLPINQLETPEVRGEGEVGRLELAGLSTSTNLIDEPGYLPADEEAGATAEYHAQRGFTPFVGFVAKVMHEMDLGVRFSPSAPMFIRMKYQFAGEPESLAKEGNISAAVLVAPGLMLGREGDNSTRIIAGNFAVLGGYRISENHLTSLAAFYTFGTVSGVSQTAARDNVTAAVPTTATSTAGGVSASASQLGIALGHQYSAEALFIRLELALVTGSMSETKLGGMSLGGVVGLQL